LSGRAALPPPLAELLDRLEQFYGKPQAPAPDDPYELIVFANCGYPPSEDRCRAGFIALERELGISPRAILGAPEAELTRLMRAGGIVPELRATRLRQIARTVQHEFGGSLQAVLREPLPAARRALKRFPTIGDPGADKILLISRTAPVAAVPSNALQVPLRLGFGAQAKSYSATYRSVQQAIGACLTADCHILQRAYLLLKQHGEQLCKRNEPRCLECPLSERCIYFRRRSRKKRGAVRTAARRVSKH
jgi:endonuclease-3